MISNIKKVVLAMVAMGLVSELIPAAQLHF